MKALFTVLIVVPILSLYYPALIFAEILLFILFYLRSSRKVSRNSVHREPKVSVIIPAKNEENEILRCVDQISHLNYKNMEIVVIDDRSTDKTRELLDGWLKKYRGQKKITILTSPQEPPEGFTGKPYAADFAISQSSGDIILVTDVDVLHSKDSLQSSIHYFLENQVSLMVRIPFMQMQSVKEWPLLFFIFILKFSSWFGKIFSPKGEALSLGTYALFTRAFYVKSGGWKKNRSFPDTFALAVFAIQNNFRYAICDDDTQEIQSHMYQGFGQLFRGIVRNTNFNLISDFPLFATVLVVFFAVDALIKIMLSVLMPFSATSIILELVVFMLLFGVYLYMSKYPLRVVIGAGILSPVLGLIFLIISCTSIIRTIFDLPVIWRGRPLKVQ